MTRYPDVAAILRPWMVRRLEVYELRRRAALAAMKDDMKTLSAKARFITDVIEGRITVMNEPEAAVHARLTELKYVRGPDGFAHLTSMPIQQLTKESKDRLLQQEAALKRDVKQLAAATPADLWKRELKQLLALLGGA